MEASDADFAAAASSLDESELLSSFMWAAGEPGSDRQAEGQSWVDDESIDIDLRPVHLRTGDGLVGGIRPVGEVSLLQADLTKSLRPRRTCCRCRCLRRALRAACLVAGSLPVSAASALTSRRVHPPLAVPPAGRPARERAAAAVSSPEGQRRESAAAGRIGRPRWQAKE